MSALNLNNNKKKCEKKQTKHSVAYVSFIQPSTKTNRKDKTRVLQNLKTAVASKKQNISHAGSTMHKPHK